MASYSPSSSPNVMSGNTSLSPSSSPMDSAIVNVDMTSSQQASTVVVASTGTPPRLNSDSNNNNLAGRAASSTTHHKQLPTQDERTRASEQANECLDAMRNEGFQLDGFNLLGVVANPRSGMVGGSSLYGHLHHQDSSSSSSSPSRRQQQQLHHQQQQQPQHLAGTAVAASAAAAAAAAAAVASGDDGTSHDMFTDAARTLEYTLAQVTEQIETLNQFLGELSRQYLGDDTGGESLYLEYYYQDVDDGTSPHAGGGGGGTAAAAGGGSVQLSNLQQLQDLQSYLEECGVLAHSLFALGLETRTTTYTADGEPENAVTMEALDGQLKDMPCAFFDTDFDLTDPSTFIELLLQTTSPASDDNGGGVRGGSEVLGYDGEKAKTRSSSTLNGNKGDYNSRRETNSLYQPTHELVPVKEPDTLAGFLDSVELALQEQVRDKSTAFFHETTRFRQLQANIEDLLQQVDMLRTQLQQALSVYRQSKDISNHQRQDYERLIQLLEGTMELVRCKASIGGLLSANDHLGAAHQIHYGRRLLQGGSDVTSDHHGIGTTATSNSSLPIVVEEGTSVNEGGSRIGESHDTNDEVAPKLQQLTALSTCEAQFSQYEELVIHNLSEELVDIFFNWRPNEKERVQEMVHALQLCHALGKTSELYQRRLQQTIRMTVRTTIAEFVESSGAGGASASSSSSSGLASSGGGGVTGMSYPAFYSCLQLLIEEMQSILRMAHTVDGFCHAESIFVEERKEPQQEQQQRWTNEALTQGAELATKSIAELLRLRKESHSLISLVEMRQLWDTCLSFTSTMEGYGDNIRAVSLRSTLVNQAKAFLDRTHESNMSALVAALDSERWSQCEVSTERQAALTRLCTGLATVATPIRNFQDEGEDDDKINNEKKPIAVVEGVNYKVVWSCLLLVETIMTNLSAAAHFQSIAPNAVTKVVELLRLFNTRTTNLVLGAGAIHSVAKLKSINAKHLSYVTQCLGMIVALLPHIRAALMAQLPSKQHSLLADLDKIRKEYQEHNENVLNKFVSIIGGIVEHGLAPRIANTKFDARARDLPYEKLSDIQCCVFLEGISNSTMKLHQVLSSLLPPDHLQDVFSRIFAYLDQKIPALFVSASAAPSNQQNTSPSFEFPSTDEGKRRMVLEVSHITESLNALDGVHPWDFTAMNVLERKMDYRLPHADSVGTNGTSASDEPQDTPTEIPSTEGEEEGKERIEGGETTEGNGTVTSGTVVDQPCEVIESNGNSNTENGGEVDVGSADEVESLEKAEESPAAAVVVEHGGGEGGGTIGPAIVNGEGPSSHTAPNGDSESQHDKDAVSNEVEEEPTTPEKNTVVVDDSV